MFIQIFTNTELKEGDINYLVSFGNTYDVSKIPK